MTAAGAIVPVFGNRRHLVFVQGNDISQLIWISAPFMAVMKAVRASSGDIFPIIAALHLLIANIQFALSFPAQWSKRKSEAFARSQMRWNSPGSLS
jgi:hypothetical protein